MSPYTIAQKAKAVAAFIMAAAAVLPSVLAGTGVLEYEVGSVNVGYLLSAVVAICSYVVTFKIPNSPVQDSSDVPDAGSH